MMLLALFLLAQEPAKTGPKAKDPERVVVVARPGAREGALHKLSSGIANAFRRLHEKTDPTVDRGNSLAAEGDPDGALRAYDEAQKKLGEPPQISYDRSTALVKKDPKSAPEAASEAQKALEHGDASLQAKAAYQLGLAQEAMGKPEEAMKSYASALALNPNDEDAKVNLELLLKTKEERKQKQQEAQQKQDKQEQKKDKGEPSKGGEDKGKEQKEQAGKDKKEEQPKNQAGDQQPKPDQEKKQEQAQAAEKPVDRSEADRLLDALRASEKNLQSWRFAKDKRKNVPRGDAEKDW